MKYVFIATDCKVCGEDGYTLSSVSDRDAEHIVSSLYCARQIQFESEKYGRVTVNPDHVVAVHIHEMGVE